MEKSNLLESGIPVDLINREAKKEKLGRAKPQAAVSVMRMLGKLDDDEIIRAVRKINKLQD